MNCAFHRSINTFSQLPVLLDCCIKNDAPTQQRQQRRHVSVVHVRTAVVALVVLLAEDEAARRADRQGLLAVPAGAVNRASRRVARVFWVV
jgi:hypothetical protein